MRRRGRKSSPRRRSPIKKYSRSFRRQNTHSYLLRKSNVDAITLSVGGVNAQGSVRVNPGDFNNYSALTALYDQYKINWVKVTFTPKFPSQLSTTATAANYNAYYFTCLDYDSYANTLFTRGSIQEYRNCKTTRLTQSHTRTFKPYALTDINTVATTGVNVSSLLKRGGWFDMASPVDTFNLRYYFDTPTELPTDNIMYDIGFVMSVSCKNVR